MTTPKTTFARLRHWLASKLMAPEIEADRQAHQRLWEMVENPPPPNEKLKALFRDYGNYKRHRVE